MAEFFYDGRHHYLNRQPVSRGWVKGFIAVLRQVCGQSNDGDWFIPDHIMNVLKHIWPACVGEHVWRCRAGWEKTGQEYVCLVSIRNGVKGHSLVMRELSPVGPVPSVN